MNWEKISLSEVIEKPVSGEWGDGEGFTKVIRTTNFTNEGTLDLSDVVCRNIPANKIDKKKLQFGDIIIEKSGGSPKQPVGRVVYFNIENEIYLCNNFTSVLRPKKGISSRYLFWCLFSGHVGGSTLSFQNKTTGIINLQLERYCNEFLIPIPPLHIQEQIANTLDKADALRRKDQELLTKYDELAQAIFYDMFGDPVKNESGKGVSISELCIINPKKSEIERIGDFEVSFIPMEAVSEKGEVELKYERLFSEVNKGFTYFKNDDVLFAKITPCMENGKGGIVTNLKNGIGFGSTEFHVLRPSNGVSSEYVQAILSLPTVRKQAEKNMTGSAGQKRVPKSFFDTLCVPLPDEIKINKFTSSIQSIKRQKEIHKDSFEQSQKLFSGLLSNYFS